MAAPIPKQLTARSPFTLVGVDGVVRRVLEVTDILKAMTGKD